MNRIQENNCYSNAGKRPYLLGKVERKLSAYLM